MCRVNERDANKVKPRDLSRGSGFQGWAQLRAPRALFAAVFYRAKAGVSVRSVVCPSGLGLSVLGLPHSYFIKYLVGIPTGKDSYTNDRVLRSWCALSSFQRSATGPATTIWRHSSAPTRNLWWPALLPAGHVAQPCQSLFAISVLP